MSKEKTPVEAKDLVSFIDGQRSIIGQLVSENTKTITVRNPASVHLQPTQDGQIQVQLFPVWFSELLSEKQRDSGTEWNFNKSGITTSNTDIELDNRLVDQYNRTFGLVPESKIVTPKGSDKVIKLFDE
jgi:hypothetical protein